VEVIGEELQKIGTAFDLLGHDHVLQRHTLAVSLPQNPPPLLAFGHPPPAEDIQYRFLRKCLFSFHERFSALPLVAHGLLYEYTVTADDGRT